MHQQGELPGYASMKQVSKKSTVVFNHDQKVGSILGNIIIQSLAYIITGYFY